MSPRIADTAGWSLTLRLTRFGRDGDLDKLGDSPVTPELDRVTLEYGGLTMWYRNTPDGLKQAFKVHSPPDTRGNKAPVVIGMEIETSLLAALSEDHQSVLFKSQAGHAVLRYAELLVFDAGDRPVPAEMRLQADQLELLIWDAGAQYPLLVDPLLTSASWTAEADQADAAFGWSVATAGDVNGDGYSDVIVGARTFDAGETDEGRAFVYHGSASGLATTADWTAEGDQAGALFGLAVGSAGDVDGDGFDDVIVGSRFDNGESEEGRAQVFHGSASGLSATAGWTVESNQAGAELGFSVAMAGDVNGDGYSDVIVGVPFFDNGQTDEGEARVYHGSATGLSTTAAWTAEGDQAGAFFGRSVATAGDVDGDGFADVIVGAPSYNRVFGDEGEAYVFLGSGSGLAATAAWTAGPPGLQTNVQFGDSVATAGDVNGDGYSDVIVGGRLFDNGHTDEGRAFVYHGSATGPSTTADWTAESNQSNAEFGFSVAPAGDVNGDGFSDVIIGSHLYDNGETDEGRAFVYHGSESGLASTAAWTAEADQADAHWGHSVATAGDVDGDGFSDVIVGAHLYDNGETDEGRASVYHGSGGGLDATPAWSADGGQANAELGLAVAFAGDVNGDGFSDAIIGAPFFDNGETDEGRAFVYLGGAGGLDTVINWMAESDQAGAQFGASVGGAGDVNGDGYSDIIVGAPLFDNGETDEGRAYVFLGGASGPAATAAWTAESDEAGAEFASAVTTAGDVNGDGYGDVIVGAPLHDAGATDAGTAFVFLGSPSGLAAGSSWSASGSQADEHLGSAVATAGDVDGNGYCDVIIGAPDYDGGQTDEGRALAFLGSSSGLALTAAWTAESNQAGALLGAAAGTAGDVNGDGYSDVIVGAPSFDRLFGNEGEAWVFHGSAVGLSATADWQVGPPGLASNVSFGSAVATAGDVNGDGYSDVIVGAPLYDNGELDEGGVFVYRGTSGGLAANFSLSIDSDQSGAEFGSAVAGGGDANGDGFGDVIASSPLFDTPTGDAGRVEVFHGAGGDGVGRAPRQARADNTALLQILGKSDSETSSRLQVTGRSPLGRGWVALEWEVKPLGVAFDGTGTGKSASFFDTGAPSPTDGSAVDLDELISGLTGGTSYHWRLRIISFHPFFPRSPWLSLPANSPTEQDFRTRLGNNPPVAICKAITKTTDANCEATAMASEADGGTFDEDGDTFTLSLSPPGPYTLGANTVTLTATDTLGASGSCVTTITVIDDTGPQVTCSLLTESADGNCEALVPDVTSSLTMSDNCSAVANLTVIQDPAAGVTVGLGSHSIDVTVLDEAGNSTMCTATLVVEDNTGPGLVCPSPSSTSADGNCQATIPDVTGGVFATDNCSAAQNIVISQSPTAGTVVSLGAHTITVTGTDEAGNSSNCTTTFTVTDDTAPSATCPAPTSVSAGPTCQQPIPAVTTGVTASDNCTAAGSLTITQSPAAGTLVSAGMHTITVTVTDAAGNSTTCMTTFTVDDDTAPSVTCPAPTSVSADSNCEASIPDILSSVTATDNCTAPGSLTLSQSPTAGTTVGLGVHTITVTATDEAGNSSICTTTFTVSDTTAPAAVCPVGTTASADANCQGVVPDVTGGVFATDNCTTFANLVIAQSPTAGTIVGLGVHTITVTVTDENSNVGMCTTTFTVVDNAAPSATCPPGTTVSADANCQAAVPDVTGDVVAADNCTAVGNLTITQSPTAGTVVGLGTMTIVITVTDEAGNSSTCTAPFTVEDTTRPSATCPAGTTVSADANCQATIPDVTGGVTASDNCTAAANLTITQSPTAGTTVSLGVHTIVVIVTDEAGNSRSCSTSFTVDDTTAPSVACPAATTVSADANCQAAIPDVTGGASATDNCTASAAITLTQSPVAGTLVGLGAHNITVIATDAAGNSNSCMTTFTVEDTTAPSATCPAGTTVSADANCMAVVPDVTGGVVASDNCTAAATLVVTQSPTAGTSVGLGTTTITVTVTDEAGNSTLCTTTFTVEDTTPPSATCPAPTTASADASCQAAIPDFTAGVTASDNCSAAAALSLSQNPVAGTVVGLGGHTITVTVTDEAGNSSMCTTTFSVEDNTPPSATCPAPTTASADGNCQAPVPDVIGGVTASDNCSAAVNLTVTQSPSAGTLVGLGNTTITVTVTDEAGNQSTCITTFTVNDDTPPSVSCPAPSSASADASCQAALPDLTAGATASDNCSAAAAITLSQSPAAGTLVALGATTVTITGTDEAGNQSTCTTTFTVNDDTPPSATCPAPTAASADANCQAPIPDVVAGVTAGDNCSAAAALNITQVPLAGTPVSLGTHTITVTVADEAGNSTSCSTTFTVEDNTPPTASCPAPTTASADASCQAPIPDVVAGVLASDNCTAAAALTITQSPLAGTLVSLGTHNITVTVTDDAGNDANCTTTFTVEDDTPPSVSCPGAMAVSADANCQAVVPNLTGSVTAGDNCTAAAALIVTQSPVPGAVVGLGTHAITLTVTDEAGNDASCNTNLTVEDNTPPSVTCPPPDTAAADANCEATVPDFTATLVTTDNCTALANLIITQSPTAGTIVGLGSHNVTLTVTDEAGNDANCNTTLTVNDTTPPAATCPAPTTASADASCTAVVPDVTSGVSATDNCTAAVNLTLVQAPAPGATVGLGAHTIIVTVTDEAGNDATCTTTFTVEDDTPPSVSCPVPSTASADASCQAAVPDLTAGATAGDNCTAAAGITLNQSPAAGTLVGLGATTVTITATDEAGNAASCTTTFNVNDNTAPTATCPAPTTASADASCQAPIPDVTAGVVASDNCSAAANLTLTQSPTAGTLVGPGPHTITVTVTDVAGNSTTCNATFIVDDDAPPSATCPAATTVSADANCQAPVPDVTAGVVANDNCTAAAALTIAQSPLAGTLVSLGTHTITVTVTDAAGNSSTCATTLTVEDNTPPTATCPAPTIASADANCQAPIPDVVAGVVAVDNCTTAAALTITQSPLAGTLVSLGVHTITVTVTDETGNTTNCTTSFTVEDNTPPTATCPAPSTVSADANCQASIPDVVSGVVASDNCTATAALVITQSPLAGTLVSLGTHTITVTVTDTAGNNIDCTTNFTVEDNTAPSATCPAPTAASADASCTAVVPDVAGGVTASDNCSPEAALLVSQSPAAGTSVGLGTTTITVTVTDAAGNSTTCTTTFTVEDSTPPAAACPTPSSTSADADCQAAIPDVTSGVVASDNCSAVLALAVTQSPVAGTVVSLGSHTITVTVTDEAANSATCTTTFTVTDDTAPAVSCPAPGTANADVNCQAVVPDLTTAATASDNCTPAGSLSIVQSPVAGALVGLGTHVITLTATDAAGNANACTTTLTVVDSTAPSVACPPPQTASADANCSATVPDLTGALSTSDNCTAPQDLAISQSPPPGSVVGLGVHNITLTVTDAAGNANSCMLAFNVVDNSDPTITCPAAQSVDAGAACTAVVPDFVALASAADNCSMGAALVITQVPVAGASVGLGTHLVTLTATDAAGNAASCNVDFTVVDATLPDLSCGAPQSAVADASCMAAVPDFLATSTASDNCTAAAAITLSQSPTAGSTVGVGTHTVVVTATDQAGNQSTCSTSFTVTDETAPAVSCPAEIIESVSKGTTAPAPDVTSMVTVTDNCTAVAAISLTQDPAAGTELALGVHIITVTAADTAGNSSTCKTSFTVQDSTAPSVTCPPPSSVDANANCQGVIPDITDDVVATDNTGSTDLTITQSPAAGTVVALGAHTIVVTVTDNSGNSSTCTTTVTVADTTAPSVTCPAGNSAPANASCNATVPDYTGAVSASDNCTAANSLVVTQTPAPGALVTVGTHNVVVSVTDAAGNVGSCTVTFTVVDATPPTITCPPAATLAANAGCQAPVPDLAAGATMSDNCTAIANLSVTQDPPAGMLVGLGAHVVTVTVTDAAGNGNSCTSLFTVEDQSPPSVTCPAGPTLSADAACEAPTPDIAAGVVAGDNCTAAAALTVSQSPSAGTLVGLGTHTVTVTVTDAAGNAATCTSDFTVADTTPPVASCSAAATVPADAGCQALIPDVTAGVTATDNCTQAAALVVRQSPAAGTAVGLGRHTITVTVTDAAGNSTDCTTELTVEDSTPPVATCPAELTLGADGSCQASVPDVTAGVLATDNCTVVNALVVTQSPAAGAMVGLGAHLITVTVTDESGNRSTCTTTVNVVDTTGPSISCPSGSTVAADKGCQAVVPDLTGAVSVTDNCTPAGSLLVAQSPVAGALVGLGTHVVTLTVTDAAGNANSCTTTLTVADGTAPSFTCPPPQTAGADTSCTAAVPDFAAALTTSDNCTPSDDLTISQSPPAGTVVGLGVHNITLTVTDEAGNTNTCGGRFEVVDDTDPTITCPTAQSVDAGATCTAEVPDFAALASAADNCSMGAALVVTQAPAAGSVVGLGRHTVTLTATDAAGNTASCDVDFSVVDAALPDLICGAPQSAAADANCMTAVPDFLAMSTASDNCSPAAAIALSQSPTAGSVVGLGTHTVVVTATDEAGNQSTCSTTFTVTDETAPAVSCPAEIVESVSKGATSPAPDVTAVVTVADNCTAVAAISLTQDPAAGTELALGVHVITVTATDTAGNSATCTTTLRIQDSAAPSVTCPPPRTIDADENCQGTIPDITGDVVAVDNTGSSDLTITQSPAAGTVVGLGLHTIEVTATDTAGNSSMCTTNVTVADAMAPVITMLGSNPESVECGSSYEDAGAVAIDACEGDVSAAIEVESDIDLFVPGTYTVTYTAADSPGNQAVATRTVIVVDMATPEITLLGENPVTIECGDAYKDTGATAADACRGDVTDAITVENNVDAGAPGTYTVLYRVEDPEQNFAEATRTVHVVDTTPPELSCPASLNVSPSRDCEYVGPIGAPEVTDNCSAAEEIAVTNDAPEVFELGTTVVTWTATDAAGNASMCEMMVTVEDTAPPAIQCPENLEVECGSRDGAGVLFTATATDDCDAAPSVVCVPASGSVFPIGVTRVVCTATDAAGNVATCSFEVNVVCTGGLQKPGDCNQDGRLDVSDPVCLLNYQFAGQPKVLPCDDGSREGPGNTDLLDWNGDRRIDVSDPIAMFIWLFGDGPIHPLGVECVRIRGCEDACDV